MTGNVIGCGHCGRELQLGNQDGATLIEVACWYCDSVNVVNQYKMTLKATKTDV